MRSITLFKALTFILLAAVQSTSFSQTSFYYTGSVQYYTVPTGTTHITVDVQGAAGGVSSECATYPDRGGYGGRTQAILTVTPGAVLQIYVGGRGDTGRYMTGGAGGYNGGGTGGYAGLGITGGGGGGASDIRTGAALSTRVVVAGGGGGAAMECASPGYPDMERGGDGGKLTGGDGRWGCFLMANGGGGTQTAGGIGGYNTGALTPYPGFAGSLGTGGNAGSPSTGGGGGGGYYGGGGGEDGGGGGGSNYADPVLVTSYVMTQGFKSGDGLVIIDPTICTGPPAISPIVGPDTVCRGGHATFTDATPYGHWSVTNWNVIVSLTGIATGIYLGTDTIIYTTSNACGSRSDSMVVVIDTLPVPAAITGSLSVCVGGVATATDATPGGTWTSGATDTATIAASTGIITGIVAGTAPITYSNPSGCHVSAVVTVDPLPEPISGASVVCYTFSTLFTDPTPSGSWSSSNPSVAPVDAMTGLVTGGGVGTATITYTMPGGCSTTQGVNVISCTTDTRTVPGALSSLAIAPNPGNGVFTVSGSAGFLKADEATLEVTDITGHTLITTTTHPVNGSISATIDISSTAANGLYLVRLSTASGNKTFLISVHH